MLARDVDLVIADEPTANLDPELVGETLALFRNLGNRVAVVIVTHDGKVAEQCDRTIVLQAAATRPDSATEQGKSDVYGSKTITHLPRPRSRVIVLSSVGVVLIASVIGGVAWAQSQQHSSSRRSGQLGMTPKATLPVVTPPTQPPMLPTATPTSRS